MKLEIKQFSNEMEQIYGTYNQTSLFFWVLKKWRGFALFEKDFAKSVQ
jgi:hypothetical protein